MKKVNTEPDFFSPANLLNILKTQWKWFILSIACCMGLGFLYLVHKEKQFTRTAQLLIKDQTETSALSASGELSGLDIFNQGSNMWNEIAVLQSPDLMVQVVRRLDLNNKYTLRKNILQNKSLYGDSIPLRVEFSDSVPDFSFTITAEANGDIELSSFKRYNKKLSGDFTGKVGQVFKTPVGDIKILATPAYASMERPFTIRYAHRDAYQAALDYCKRVNVSNESSRSSVVQLSIIDPSIKRGDDILRELINVYNDSWKADKNQIAVNTTNFINERLVAIESELGNVDADISEFKSSNLLPDLAAVSNIYMQQASSANANILTINNRLYMARYINDLLSTLGPDKTIPVNSGFEDQTLAQQIAKYNDMVISRNNLASVSSDNNPIVRDMDASVADMRRAIQTGVESRIVALEKELKAQQNFEGEAVGHIASNPEQAKYLLSVERQQKVKESLYLYLLQKLEENELTQTYNVYNNRVVIQPNGSRVPTAPRKKMILMAAFVFGFLLPYAFFFVKDKTETTIRSASDLSMLTVPRLGEIPMADGTKKLGFLQKLFKRKTDEKEPRQILVARGNRNVINEAFRILRTNLEMITGRGASGNVVTVTSFNPGSGKSFITVNLASAITLKDKKVIVIDCDLRHGSASEYVGSPRHGLAEYLSGSIDDYKSLLTPADGNPNLLVLPTGQIPPNPTELLENGRLETLINNLRTEADYVLIDCPPVDIVADTHIIDQYADRTIFVVRIGLLDRTRVPELEEIYTAKRLVNMCYVVNGTIAGKSRYYSDGKRSAYYVNS